MRYLLVKNAKVVYRLVHHQFGYYSTTNTASFNQDVGHSKVNNASVVLICVCRHPG